MIAVVAAVACAALLAALLVERDKPRGSGRPEDVRRLVAKLTPVFPEMERVRWSESANDETFIREKAEAFLCTRDARGNPYPDDVLTFVVLHELAHALETQFGHGPSWETTFQGLLDRARRHRLLDPQTLRPQTYCRYNLLGNATPS